MHTVTPAKMTARPEVLIGSTVEASTSMPRRRLARWRLTMNKRVVDADPEPDQGGEGRTEDGDVEHVRGQADERRARCRCAIERGQQRQQHRQQRAERQEDDDARGDDADELRQAGLRAPARVLDGRAAEFDLQVRTSRRPGRS